MSTRLATADSVLFAKSCSEAATFPKNIARQTSPRNHLERFYNRLNEQSNRLFCEDGQAAVNILEYDDNIEGFQSTCLSSHFELKGSIEGVSLFSRKDPKCRFVFIHAKHSRDRLRISRRMLDAVLTYHQVMPGFLDFMFPFGMQDRLEDFYFSGLREETRLQLPNQGLVIPELGRSGRDLRLCYNLKSVEASTSDSKWPWSIRQMAVYNSFDVDTGKTLWIVLKGNQLIEERLQAATSEASPGLVNLNSFGSIEGSFASSLATHLVVCDWADEDWRWYLNYLEKQIQDATDRSLVAFVGEPTLLGRSLDREMKPPSSHSFLRTFIKISKNVWASRSRRGETESGLKAQEVSPQHPKALTLSPLFNYNRLGMHGDLTDETQNDQEGNFSTKDIIALQYLEEKASEIDIVMQANSIIFTQLKDYYSLILESEHFPEGLKTNCKSEVAQFEKRINLMLADLQSQRLRTDTLLKILNDRKALVSGILEHRNIEASKLLAQKAQISAKRMELMTESMHEIAKKTKQETVSMKIITLVTLFFLPGTFISTIMSTDIVTFQNDARIFQHRALQLYLILTIPFTVVTFAAWYGTYLWTKKAERANERDKGDVKKPREVKGNSSIV